MPSQAWDKRNAAARALGYRNYYDYRIHGYGRRPAAAPVDTYNRDRLRGHRSRADLLRQADEGALVTYNGSERNPDGTYRWVELAVIDVDGRERIYRLSGQQLTRDALRALVDQLVDAGAILTPTKSLDLTQYASDE